MSLFNQETMQFSLHTKHTGYVMELYENPLAHCYWGSRVNEIPNLEHYYSFSFSADFSAADFSMFYLKVAPVAADSLFWSWILADRMKELWKHSPKKSPFTRHISRIFIRVICIGFFLPISNR